jgi:ATP-dependent RNA helicase DeaD
VFNFDLPEDVELYVHRVGRTGRAGKSGVAISLVTPQEQWRLRRIEGFTRQKIERASLPSAEDIQKQRDEQLESQVKIWLQRGRCRRERQLAEEMVAQGYDPLEIAAVALKLARAGEKQRPIAHIGEVQESSPRKRLYAPRRAKGSRSQKGKNTSHEKGMVRLSLSGGRRNGVRSADVVSAIARHADIPGSTIGKISIFDEYTLVDVPEQFVPQVLAKNGNYRIRKQAVTLELA